MNSVVTLTGPSEDLILDSRLETVERPEIRNRFTDDPDTGTSELVITVTVILNNIL